MFLRKAIPEERTHRIEYSVVAILIHEALAEQASNRGRVPAPALLTILLTALVGALDEGVQAWLPNRVFYSVTSCSTSWQQ